MSAVRSFGQFGAALLACLYAWPLEAQSAVTATSGDSSVIQRIRTQVGTIDRSLSRFRKVDRDIDNVSTDGGHVTAYFEGDGLRKLDVGIFSESWSRTETYYFVRGAPFFVFHENGLGDEQRDSHALIANRLYIDSGVVIRHVLTGEDQDPDDPGTFSRDPSPFTSWLPFYLRCVAAREKESPECSAPDSLLNHPSYKPTLGPTGVARHRALYEDIELRLPALRHANADLHTLKLEGTTSVNGVLDAYCEGDSIRLLVADFTNAGARATIRMYFTHDSLFFVYRHATRRVRARGENSQVRDSRWYFVDNELVRWIEDDTPLAITTDDTQAAFWLARARDLGGAMAGCTPRLRRARE